MAQQRLALYTTVHPESLPFLDAWADSVRCQTDPDFDIWIGVDDLDLEAVQLGDLERSAIFWVAGSSADNGIAVRCRAMQRMVTRYDAIVFVDSDDILHPTRIAAARDGLSDADVYGCALRVIDEEGKLLGPVFGPDSARVDWDALLPRYNILGLSNTAYRSATLAQCLPFPRECELLDWHLVTRAWALGSRLAFDPEPRMDYRQYSRNTARVLPPFRPEGIRVGTRRVVDHYRLLLSRGYVFPGPARLAVEEACEEVVAFDHAIRSSAVLLEEYTRALNRLAPRYVWWWVVAHPELKNLWKR